MPVGGEDRIDLEGPLRPRSPGIRSALRARILLTDRDITIRATADGRDPNGDLAVGTRDTSRVGEALEEISAPSEPDR